MFDENGAKSTYPFNEVDKIVIKEKDEAKYIEFESSNIKNNPLIKLLFSLDEKAIKKDIKDSPDKVEYLSCYSSDF